MAWQALMVEIADFDLHHVKGNSKLVFSFIEGPLVRAIQTGEWYVFSQSTSNQANSPATELWDGAAEQQS